MSAPDVARLMGRLIDGPQERDAIHLAVYPATAAVLLNPGEKIGLLPDGRASNDIKLERVGIVDPFLNLPVKPGQRFWLCVRPATVTSLRHHWEHPAFPEA
jgi:hypothetical protein